MNILNDSRRKIKLQLDEWRDKLDELDAQLERRKNEQDTQARDDIQALQDKVKEFQDQYELLRDKSENAWISFKVSLDNAANEFQDGIMRAVNRLKKY